MGGNGRSMNIPPEHEDAIVKFLELSSVRRRVVENKIFEYWDEENWGQPVQTSFEFIYGEDE